MKIKKTKRRDDDEYQPKIKPRLRLVTGSKDDEAKPKKKKKKRASFDDDDSKPAKELVVIDAPPKSTLVKKTKKVEQAIAIAPELRKEASELYRNIKDDETASVHLKELAYMLKANARIIRITTNSIEANQDRVDSRLIYALMTTMSQQREVIADIRMVSDSGKQIEMIHSKILAPAAIEQAGVLTGMFYQLRRLLTETSQEKQTAFALRQLESIMNDVARNTQAGYESINEKIQQVLKSTN